MRWASTMAGYSGPVRLAHADSSARIDRPGSAVPGAARATVARGQRRLAAAAEPLARAAREEREDGFLAPGASRATGGGERARDEEPDEWRTCFERDRDRILHATSFRRLAGKTQVFVFPQDHQRTRLTHALEVAQVATAMARACRLNVALTEAIALGHDCGHGPGGHASEDALRPVPARAASTTHPGGPMSRWPPSISAPRPSTASPTTPGPVPPRPPPKERWSAGPTGWPTSATTGRTPC